MNRRSFVLGSAAVAAAGVSGLLLAARSAPDGLHSDVRSRLPMPPLIDTTTTGAFTLAARAGQTAFMPGALSATYGFNQSYLGPVVKVRTGKPVTAIVTNHLDELLAVHWHGLLIPGDRDGGPHQAIEPGGVWKPTLAIAQPAATVWYHAHTHNTTAPLVHAGLAGIMLIVDGKDHERGLPVDYGVDDLVLVLQDRRFDERGRMVYSRSMMDRMFGFHGNRMLVNGTLDPSAAVPPSVVRLRLVNGSNARIYELLFDDGRNMHLIGTDSGLLPKSIALQRLRLAPGERAEVLVDFSSGKPALLLNEEYSFSSGMMAMMGNPLPLSGATDNNGNTSPVLAFEPSEELPTKVTSIPSQIDDSSTLQMAPPSRSRFLSMDMMTRGRGGMMGGGMMGGGMMGQMGINGLPFSMERIDQHVALGSVEKWTVRSTMRPHPLHLHGVHFRVLSESGQAPRLENSGWKDTVLVEDQVELLAQFTQPASPETPFMYHCHILEHEDAGMMGQFVVS